MDWPSEILIRSAMMRAQNVGARRQQETVTIIVIGRVG
jgi:hypothetical protein